MAFATEVLLFTVIFFITVNSRRETLQDFGNIGRSPSFQPADVRIEDRDNDGVAPAVELLSSTILLRVNTIPKFDDPDAHLKKENNWVFLPHIANPSENEMVQLRFTFNHNEQCPQYTHPDPVQCKNYITVMLVEMDANTDVSTITDNSRSLKVMRVNSTGGSTADISFDELITFSASTTSGYRIVIHDEGASYTVKSLMLDRYYCEHSPSTSVLPLACDDTPATITQNNSVTCTCTAANSVYPASGPITKLCVFNQAGSYDAAFADTSSSPWCDCDTGYDYTIVGNSRQCLAKPTTVTPTTVSTTTTTTTSTKFPSTVKPVSYKTPPVVTGGGNGNGNNAGRPSYATKVVAVAMLALAAFG